ncbi:hypothetical protein I8920_05635 [Curtobacterium sp. YC1]|uniref:hypothetical protein n=1 Tax=Curtobacterium sp. YC1 TaxID=2795488 RepID=UPI0018E4E1D9|nr:hypothetical protein [Curtobacterium sp. YC1]QQD77216.1 hypothetical protein I8920_05635 [Curtobacterium sp. YC1]
MDRVIGWGTLAVVVIVVVGMLSLLQTTTCVDAVPGLGTSSCTTEPMLGVAGTWIAVVIGALVVALCVWRIVRTPEHRR